MGEVISLLTKRYPRGTERIFVFTECGRVEEVIEVVDEQLVLYAREELVGRSICDVIEQPLIQDMLDALEKAASENRVVEIGVMGVRFGERKFIWMKFVPDNAAHRVVMYSGTLLNCVDERRFKEERRKLHGT